MRVSKSHIPFWFVQMAALALVLCFAHLVLAAEKEPDAQAPALPKDREDVLDQLVAAGREARDAGRFEEARRQLEKALRVARGASGGGVDMPPAGPEVISRLRFDLGLTDQLEGEQTGNDALLLSKAVQQYEEVLKDRPGSAATLFNQARAYVRLGKSELADERFRQAAALAGPDQPFYQRKYADFLAERGDWAGAAPLYEAVALARPGNTEAHDLLLLHYRDADVTGSDPLSGYLWKLIDAGEGLRAAEAAIDLLAGTASAPDLRQDALLLATVASGLARSPLDPRTFLESSTAKRLASLSDHLSAGRAVRELLKLFATAGTPTRPEEVASRLVWWSMVTPWADAELEWGVWPHDAMRSLLLALGRWYERQGRIDLAEMHARAALVLVPGDADAGAARQLIDLFIARNDLGKVQEILGEVQWPLFEGKGRAYRRGDLVEIYEYHTTLGSLYGYLAAKGQRGWGSSGDIYSAIFQLEQAVLAGQRLDEQAAIRGKTEPVHLEPGVVEYLARGYMATGQTERSVGLRLESAERFEKAGNLRATRFVLTPVKVEQVTPVDRPRFERLRAIELEKPKLDEKTLNVRELEKVKIRPPR